MSLGPNYHLARSADAGESACAACEIELAATQSSPALANQFGKNSIFGRRYERAIAGGRSTLVGGVNILNDRAPYEGFIHITFGCLDIHDALDGAQKAELVGTNRKYLSLSLPGNDRRNSAGFCKC